MDFIGSLDVPIVDEFSLSHADGIQEYDKIYVSLDGKSSGSILLEKTERSGLRLMAAPAQERSRKSPIFNWVPAFPGALGMDRIPV